MAPTRRMVLASIASVSLAGCSRLDLGVVTGSNPDVVEKIDFVSFDVPPDGTAVRTISGFHPEDLVEIGVTLQSAGKASIEFTRLNDPALGDQIELLESTVYGPNEITFQTEVKASDEIGHRIATESTGTAGTIEIVVHRASDSS